MGAIQTFLERFGFVSLERYGLERTAGGRIVSHRTAVVDTDLIVGWEDNDLDAMELPRWVGEATERTAPRPEPEADDRARSAIADLTDEAIDVDDDEETDDWKRALANARGEELGPVRVLRRADSDDAVITSSPVGPDVVEPIEQVDSGDIVAAHLEAGDNPLVDEWYSAFANRPTADAPVVISLRGLPNDESAYETYVVGVRPLRVVIPRVVSPPRPQTIIPVPPLPSVGDAVHTVIPVPGLPAMDDSMIAQPVVRSIRHRPTMPTIPPLPPLPRPRLAKGTEADASMNVPAPKLVVVPPLPRIVQPESRR